MSRNLGLDRSLGIAITLLILFGLVVLYSAGQTDVASFAATGAWRRQLVWLVAGAVLASIAFRMSPRFLEWLSLPVYWLSLLLLGLTLVIGRGAGTAAGSKSWIYIGGHAIGQPAEFAKLAAVLMLARHLSGRREAPETLRDLVPACVIAGLPALLVLAQPDLGSALVFVGVLFAMLFWAGTPPSLLFLLASPVGSLLLAFNIYSWVGWMVLLAVLLAIWRPYFWEGAPRLAGARSVPAESPPDLPEPRGRPPEGRLSRHPVQGRDRLRGVVRERLPPGTAEATGIPA
jgi:rod shape determining protein RodA